MGPIVFGDIASKILIVIGMLFVALALVAAVKEEFTRKAPRVAAAEKEEGLLQDAAALVGQLRDAPRWMSMVIVGILVIISGSALEANLLANLFGGGDVAAAAPAG